MGYYYYDYDGDYGDTVVSRFCRKDRTGVSDTGWFKPMDSLYVRCTQATYWTDASGTTWSLEDMTSIHRQNLLAWLERRAAALHRWAFENGKVGYADRGLSAEEWLLTLPLVKRLTELTYCPTCGNRI